MSDIIAHLFGGPKDGEVLALPHGQVSVSFTAPCYGKRDSTGGFPLIGERIHVYWMGEEFEGDESHIEYDYAGLRERRSDA